MHSFFSHPHLPQFSSGHCLLKLEPVLETCDFVWESMPKKVPVLKAGPPTIDRWTWREEVEHSLCFQAPLGWALPYSPQRDVQICFVYTVMELSNQEFEPSFLFKCSCFFFNYSNRKLNNNLSATPNHFTLCYHIHPKPSHILYIL